MPVFRRVRSAHQYFHTLRHLKPRQVFYRLAYFLKQRRGVASRPLCCNGSSRRGVVLALLPGIFRPGSFAGGTFRFLNREKRFNGRIDWRFEGLGRLWCYNLNYFDFLQQEGMSADAGLDLIDDFIDAAARAETCMEPYPVSLRILNWIKFLSGNGIRSEKIDACLHAQARFLARNLEYHLLGNHLLENGIALFFAAFYFEDKDLFVIAEKILAAELKEQILADGGHFELSPMYHQIILERLLDCMNLAQSNPAVYGRIRQNGKETDLLQLIRSKAGLMLGWLREMTFANGEMPLVNDAAFEIAADAKRLWDYAGRAGVPESLVSLQESGYRKIKRAHYEALLDIGRIGPDYIPGHAHADTFNFLLNIKGCPVIVDSGTSTYENNETRHAQRATKAHNTVEIDRCSQSEVWGSFRVARRAGVAGITETDRRVSAFHDGYKRLPGKPVHKRTWRFEDKGIEILDEIDGGFQEATARFYFHPDVRFCPSQNNNGGGMIQLPGASKIELRVQKGRGRWVDAAYHPQFNVSLPNRCLEVRFEGPAAGVRISW